MAEQRTYDRGISPAMASAQNLAQLLYTQNLQAQQQRQQDLYGDRTQQYNATTGAQGLRGTTASPMLMLALAQQNRGRVDPRQLAQAMGANIPSGSNGGVGSGSGTANSNQSALQMLAAQLAGQKDLKAMDQNFQANQQTERLRQNQLVVDQNIRGQQQLQQIRGEQQKDLAITDSNLQQKRKQEDRMAALASFMSGGKRVQ